MVTGKLALGLLTITLAASAAHAQTPPASTAAPAANPVDPGAIQALKDMGAHLQSLKRFSVSTELTGERVLADGQKLQHTATADLDVDRPNRVRIHMASARSERQLFYNGKITTLYTPRRSTTRQFRLPARSASSSASLRKGTTWKFHCPTCSSGAPLPRRLTRSNRR